MLQELENKIDFDLSFPQIREYMTQINMMVKRDNKKETGRVGGKVKKIYWKTGQKENIINLGDQMYEHLKSRTEKRRIGNQIKNFLKLIVTNVRFKA